MMALEQAREYLEQLGLTQAAAVLDNRLDLAAQQQLSYPEVLSDLLVIEAAARRERCLKARTRLAHLPFHRTLESSISTSSPLLTRARFGSWPA